MSNCKQATVFPTRSILTGLPFAMVYEESVVAAPLLGLNAPAVSSGSKVNTRSLNKSSSRKVLFAGEFKAWRTLTVRV